MLPHQPAADIVTEFDGVAVNGRLQEDLPVFNALVMSMPVGKPVKVKALRDGQEQSFTLVTRARGKARDNDAEFKSWGLTARNLTLLSAIERKRPDTNGVLVTTVNPAGPAGSAKPALQADDCLLSIAGKSVRSVADLTKFDGETVRCRQESDLSHFLATVRRHQTGDEVECGLLRDGQSLKLALKLQTDDPDEEDLKRFKDKELEFNLRDLTEKERVLQRIPAGVKGPRVTEVQGSGWASLAHVAVGDLLLSIDGSPTPDVAAAERLLKAAAEKKPRRLVFHLRRGVHTLFAEVEPTWDSPSAGKP